MKGFFCYDSPMTRQAFLQAQKRNSYGVVLPGYAVLAVMVVLPFVWYGIQQTHPNLPLSQRILGHAICIWTFVVGVWFVYVHLFRVEARNPHKCVHCQKSFEGTGDIVLKTNTCYYCKSQIIDVESGPDYDC